MRSLWFVVYWGTLISGTVVNQFLKRYWASGHFSVMSKSKAVMKQMTLLAFAGITLVAVAGSALVYFFGKNILQQAYLSILIIANLYGMAVLVILLAHGLIKLPLFLWKYSDNRYNVLNGLSRADNVRRAYRTALIDYHEQISICKKMEAQHSNEYNR